MKRIDYPWPKPLHIVPITPYRILQALLDRCPENTPLGAFLRKKYKSGQDAMGYGPLALMITRALVSRKGDQTHADAPYPKPKVKPVAENVFIDENRDLIFDVRYFPSALGLKRATKSFWGDSAADMWVGATHRDLYDRVRAHGKSEGEVSFFLLSTYANFLLQAVELGYGISIYPYAYYPFIVVTADKAGIGPVIALLTSKADTAVYDNREYNNREYAEISNYRKGPPRDGEGEASVGPWRVLYPEGMTPEDWQNLAIQKKEGTKERGAWKEEGSENEDVQRWAKKLHLTDRGLRVLFGLEGDIYRGNTLDWDAIAGALAYLAEQNPVLAFAGGTAGKQTRSIIKRLYPVADVYSAESNPGIIAKVIQQKLQKREEEQAAAKKYGYPLDGNRAPFYYTPWDSAALLLNTYGLSDKQRDEYQAYADAAKKQAEDEAKREFDASPAGFERRRVQEERRKRNEREQEISEQINARNAEIRAKIEANKDTLDGLRQEGLRKLTEYVTQHATSWTQRKAFNRAQKGPLEAILFIGGKPYSAEDKPYFLEGEKIKGDYVIRKPGTNDYGEWTGRRTRVYNTTAESLGLPLSDFIAAYQNLMQQYPLLSYRGVAGDFRNSVASFVVEDYRGIHTPTELENMYRVLAYKNELQDQEPLIQWPARFGIPAPLHREDFQ
jgi:hypothetical protein